MREPWYSSSKNMEDFQKTVFHSQNFSQHSFGEKQKWNQLLIPGMRKGRVRWQTSQLMESDLFYQRKLDEKINETNKNNWRENPRDEKGSKKTENHLIHMFLPGFLSCSTSVLKTNTVRQCSHIMWSLSETRPLAYLHLMKLSRLISVIVSNRKE